MKIYLWLLCKEQEHRPAQNYYLQIMMPYIELLKVENKKKYK